MLQLTSTVFLVASGQVGLSHYKDCHVYLVREGKEWALIDAGAGMETSVITDTLAALGFDPGGRAGLLLLTHAHADHAGGAAAIRRWAGCQIAASRTEADLAESGDETRLGLVAAKYSGRYPSDYVFTPFRVDLTVEESATYQVGGIRIRALSTPGHSIGSVCYVADFPDGSRGLFSGDTVFWGGYISLINAPGADLQQYRQSVQQFVGLSVDALFPGHHLWDLRRGQKHLDTAVERFRGSQLPPNL